MKLSHSRVCVKFTLFMIALCFAFPVMAQNKAHNCAKLKNFQTQVIFDVKVKPTRFDYTKSTKYLTYRSKDGLAEWRQQNADHAWVSGTDNDDWHTEGLTIGGVKVNSDGQMAAKPYDKYGAYYCPYVQSVVVNLEYGSEILIANEHKEGSCDFNAIMEHEMKHHDTNVTVFKTLAKRMELDMPKFIAYMEESYVPREQVQKSFERIKVALRDALKIYMEEIVNRKGEFNALIDTPEEYRRVSKLCEK